MFAFAMREAVVLKPPGSRYREALALPGVEPMEIRPGIPLGKWAQFPASDLEAIASWLRRRPGAGRPRRRPGRRL